MSKLNKCHNEILEIIAAFKGNRSSNSLKVILKRYLDPTENFDIDEYRKSVYSRGSW